MQLQSVAICRVAVLRAVSSVRAVSCVAESLNCGAVGVIKRVAVLSRSGAVGVVRCVAVCPRAPTIGVVAGVAVLLISLPT